VTRLRPGRSRNFVSIPGNCRRIFVPLKPADLFWDLSSLMFIGRLKLSPLTKRPEPSHCHSPHLLRCSVFKHVNERNSQSLRLYSLEYTRREMSDFLSLMGKTEFLREYIVSFLYDKWHGLAEVNTQCVSYSPTCLHWLHRDNFNLCI
jgi:hypothetical protein